MRQKLLYKLIIVLVLASMLVVACTPKTTTGTDADPLVAAAKAEGQLTVIALPHDWCNYGEAIEAFKAKYGIKVNELNPDAGSGDEIEAIKANKDNKGPQAPDVIDVGYGFGPQLIDEGLVHALQSLHLGFHPGRQPRILMATGTATITACWPSKSTRTLSRTFPRIGLICSNPNTRARLPWRVTRVPLPRPR